MSRRPVLAAALLTCMALVAAAQVGAAEEKKEEGKTMTVKVAGMT